MSGGPEPLYVLARNALLDAADALSETARRRGAAEYTTDADFCVVPSDLSDTPLLAELLGAGGFSLGEHPGAWMSPDGIPVDLMVPEVLAGAGSRGARLGPHGKIAARRAKGLEGALVDRERMEIASLEPGDERSVAMLVAGLPRCSWPRSTRWRTASEPEIESATRTHSISCVSCSPPTLRRSPHACRDSLITSCVLRSPPMQCSGSRPCSAARKPLASGWPSVRPAPTPRTT